MSPEFERSLTEVHAITNRSQAMGIGLAKYPVADIERVIRVLGAGLRESGPAIAPPVAAYDRAIQLLKAVIDEPLVTLPGGVEPGWKGPSNLSLHQFRPELSEKIAGLLEEVGA